MLRLTIVDKMVVVAFVFICEMLRKLGIMKRLDNYATSMLPKVAVDDYSFAPALLL